LIWFLIKLPEILLETLNFPPKLERGGARKSKTLAARGSRLASQRRSTIIAGMLVKYQ